MGERITTVGVVGAGTMGAGIAQVAILTGFRVLLHDPVEGQNLHVRARDAVIEYVQVQTALSGGHDIEKRSCALCG